MHQYENRERRDRLTAAGFAHQSNRFAGVDVEVYSVDSTADAALRDELHFEPANAQQRLGCHVRIRGSSASRSPSPSRLKPITTSVIAMPGIAVTCTDRNMYSRAFDS